jgi:hypothetical protein
VEKNEIPSIQTIYNQFILNENFHYYCKLLRNENIDNFRYKLYIIPKEKFQMEEYVFLSRREKDRIQAHIDRDKIIAKHTKIVFEAQEKYNAVLKKLSLKINSSKTKQNILERSKRVAKRQLDKANKDKEDAICEADKNINRKEDNKGADDWIGLRKTDAFKDFEKTFFTEGEERDLKYLELSNFEESELFKQNFIVHSDKYKSENYIELFRNGKTFNMEFQKNLGWQLWLEYPTKTVIDFLRFQTEIKPVEQQLFYQMIVMMNLLKKDSDTTKFIKLIRNWDNPQLQNLISSFDEPSELSLIETSALKKSNDISKYRIRGKKIRRLRIIPAKN